MHAKPALLQLVPLPALPDGNQRLAQDFNVIQARTANEIDAAIAERQNDITVLITSARTPTTADLIDRLPALKAICSLGVGYDSIDIGHASKKGIQVSNTPDVLNDCVADLTWGLILATSRRLGAAERYLRANQWGSGAPLPLATKVSRKKLGIVGLGRVGMAIAQRSTGFDMQVRYHSRRARPDTQWDYEASLMSLAQWADILVISTVGGPSTQNLINQNVLEAIGPQGLLINISRGSVVDETALVQALLNGKLGGAGLDVYQAEPHVPDELKNLDNVVLLPHIASATLETRHDMSDLVVQNAHAFATTGKVITAVH